MRTFEETCRAEGLRVTHQRTEIFRTLASTDVHPDAEAVHREVHGRIPAISLDTVYRTLATLEEHGLIRRTGVLGGPARFDANVGEHHHFICTECGAVQDFQSEALDDLPLPKSVASFGRVGSTQVQVRGVCRACLGDKGPG